MSKIKAGEKLRIAFEKARSFPLDLPGITRINTNELLRNGEKLLKISGIAWTIDTKKMNRKELCCHEWHG